MSDDEHDVIEDAEEEATEVDERGQVVTTPVGIDVWLVKHTGLAWNEAAQAELTEDVPGQWHVMVQTPGRKQAGMRPTRWALVCDHQGAPVNRDINIHFSPQLDAEIYAALQKLMPTVGRLQGNTLPVAMRDGRPVEL